MKERTTEMGRLPFGGKLAYGAAYYLEYMPYDRIDTDFRWMKEAGMNLIRIAESTWSTLEPRDGEFDFRHIDRMLEKAGEYGLQVIVGTPTYAIPSWMDRKYPAVTTREGHQVYGRRQNMDITEPVFRRYAERVVRRLMEHVAQHPAVIGYQIDNETKYYGTSSGRVHALFVEHLKQKFGTVEALNEAYGLAYWSNSISGWEDFPNPDGTINGSIATEYDRFRRSLAADYLKWQASVIEEYRREDQFITHNFDFDWEKGYSFGVQRDINHLEASGAVSVCGCDIYHPSQEKLTGLEIAFGGDSIRAMKHAPYIVLETEAQAFKEWTPFPGQLSLQAYSHLASGAHGVEYWHWHSIHNSMETYWKGVLSHDLEKNRIYEEAGVIGRCWREIGERAALVRKDVRVALITDNHSLDALDWFPIDRGCSYNQLVMEYYQALYEQNIECDVLDVHALDVHALDVYAPGMHADGQAETLERYDMLVTPALYSASQETIDRLRGFVERGGVLVSSLRSFVADDDIKVWPTRAPHDLTDVFGMYYQEIAAAGTTKVRGEAVRHMIELTIPQRAEVLMPYEHPYWGGSAAVTANSFGKGRAFYIASVLPAKLLREVLRGARDAACARHPEHAREAAETAEGFGWPVIARSGVNAADSAVHYLLHYSAESREVVCPYAHVRNLLDDAEYREGDLIPLKDWGAAVLEELPGDGRRA